MESNTIEEEPEEISSMQGSKLENVKNKFGSGMNFKIKPEVIDFND